MTERHLCLFDLDGTLIPTDSDHAFGEFKIDLGWADAAEHQRASGRHGLNQFSGKSHQHVGLDIRYDQVSLSTSQPAHQVSDIEVDHSG